MDFTSTSPLPPIRHDISGFEYIPGTVVLYDDNGYAENEIRVPTETISYLELMDGTRTAEYLAEKAARAGRSFSMEGFLKLVEILEREHFLDTPRFRARREECDRAYNELPVRPAAHAGVSYPSEPAALRSMLDGFLGEKAEAGDANAATGNEPVAVIAPHIDFRVGGASYGPAYRALMNSTADTFVIFGVAHKISYDTFMISSKDFDTPLGILPTDRELIEHFRGRLPFQLTRNEIAHRSEHSIEFQAVFLRHIFPDRDIKIVPILAGSLHSYVEFGEGDARDDEALTALYDTLAASAAELGRSVCYIAGADLCHIGRKFGDKFAARTILDKVRQFDERILQQAATPNADAFLQELAGIRNRYRVCGVSPIYATLRTARPTSGNVLCYEQWDESERDSAVTFASVALYR